MDNFIIYIIIGFASGLIVFPIGLWLYLLIKNTKERRRIKKLIKQDKFLVPIDTRDYDSKAWTNQKYGNIDLIQSKKDLDNLDNKIFKRIKILKEDNEFFNKVLNYLIEARKQGISDEQIKETFKKKKYSNELINRVFEYKI